MIKDKKINGLQGLSSFQKEQNNLDFTNNYNKLDKNPKNIIIEINELSKQTRITTWMIGMRLKKLKELFQSEIKSDDNPNWKDWIDKTFNYSHTWSDKLINLYERFHYTDLKRLPEDRSKQLEIARISDNKKRYNIIEKIDGKNITLWELKKMISGKHESDKPKQKATQVALIKNNDYDQLTPNFLSICSKISLNYRNINKKDINIIVKLAEDLINTITKGNHI